MLTVGSLFSGIGGYDLGLERAGMHVIWQCEADPFCRRVLARHWPHVPCYSDVRDVDARAPRVDVLCGGFPCQPVSQAGKQLAQEDERWLWPEFARVIRELRPRYVLVENVPGLLHRGMGDVLGCLAELGYDAEWGSVRATDAGASHSRERVWIVAYPDGRGREPGGKPGDGGQVGARRTHPRHAPSPADASSLADAAGIGRGQGRQGRSPRGSTRTPDETRGPRVFSDRPRPFTWLPEPDVARVAHGIPDQVDRCRALGNALVPAVAQWIGRQVIAYEREDIAA